MGSCFLIVEIGQAHDGSLELHIVILTQLHRRRFNWFQTHIAEAESTQKDEFRSNFSYEDANRYEYWKRMEFTEQQWIGIKEHCDSLGIIFLSSAF